MSSGSGIWRICSGVARGSGFRSRMNFIRTNSSRQLLFGRIPGCGAGWQLVHAARTAGSLAASTEVASCLSEWNTAAPLRTVPKPTTRMNHNGRCINTLTRRDRGTAPIGSHASPVMTATSSDGTDSDSSHRGRDLVPGTYELRVVVTDTVDQQSRQHVLHGRQLSRVGKRIVRWPNTRLSRIIRAGTED